MRMLIVFILLILFLTSCSSHQKTARAQGYIEGRYTYMASPVSGVLENLSVMRGNKVKKGDLLFTLDPQPESDLYNAAAENLKQAQAARDVIAANLTYAKITYERYKLLVPQNAAQKSLLDSAKATYESTLAQLNQAEATIAANTATLAQSNWTKNQKLVVAPVDGEIFDTYYRLGEYTQSGKPVLSLLAPVDIKVIFYVPESVLGAIQLNDRVSVHCDGCTQSYPATIDFISPTAEYTPPLIFSEQTSSKLIFRIEAAFAPAEAMQLHPGQPMLVDYHPHG